MRRLLLLVTMLAAVVVPRPAGAQVLYGSLTGNVTDQTGAVVAAAAKVEALNVATNVARSTATDSRGNYLFSNLEPGTYQVTVKAPGFKTLVQKGVRIVTNAVQRVDIQLEVSQLSETVEVTSAPPILQTDRADVRITQSSKEVNDLPLYGTSGRNYQSLMEVVPGATIDRTQNGQGEANSAAASPQRSISFNVNGVSGWENQTKIDGSSVVYVWLPTNTAYVPSAEAIGEVNIVTSSYTAEQGLVGGAAVNVVIKTGTNRVHATAWGYDTNSHFKARNVFQTTPKPAKDILAQFGGNLGGPIVPNKVFFFGNIERTTRRTSSPVVQRTIAPANLRPVGNGGVHFPTPAEGGAIIYDPASNPDPSLRTPFPDNTIPGNRIDQAAKYLTDRLPATNAPGYVNNIIANGVTAYNRTNMDFKVNYAGSSRLSMFARYSNSPSTIVDPYAFGAAGGGALNGGNVGTAPGRTQVFGAGLTYSFAPSLMLDANFGYTHQVLGAQANDIGINVGSDPDKMNIPGTNGPDPLQGGLPSFQIANWTNLGNDNTGNPFQFRDNQYVGSLSLQWVKTPHVFRVGVGYSNQQINHFQPQGGTFQTVRGTFQFNGLVTELQGDPNAPKDARFNSWAQFLLGLPTGAGKVDQLRNPNSLIMPSWSAYAQDTWQVTRNFTAMIGVRWELYVWPTRPNGLGVSRFDPTDGFVYNGGVGGTPRNTFASSGSGNFVPRLGLTYRFKEKTVLRAGYGQSVDPTSFINFRNSYPIVNAWQMPAIIFNGKQNTALPVTTLRQGLINSAPVPDLTAGKLPLPSNTGTTTYPKDQKRHVLHSWNLAVQRELKPWLTAQVAYVGTWVIQQPGFININAGAPGTGDRGRALFLNGLNLLTDISSVQPYGDTTYNGLQAELRVRSGSAQAGAAYTFSKTINYFDNQGGNGPGVGGPAIQYMPAKQRNKGLAGYDRTHNLQVYGVWDLPFGKGRKLANQGVAKALLADWEINGVLSVMSGVPLYINQGNTGNLNAAGSRQIPDQIKQVTVYHNNKVNIPPAGADPTQYQYFDRSAFQAVNIPLGQPQRFGNVGRNTIRGPGYWNVDFGVFRTIALPGEVKLQLRAEAINLLNHPNFSNPGSDISNAGQFGFISSTTATGERNIRFGLRLSF